MTTIRSRLRRPGLWRCGLALIVAGSAATAKAQCMSGGGGAAAAATGGTATAFRGAGTGVSAFGAASSRPVFGTPQIISGNAQQAAFFGQQAALQAQADANQRALARKLAIMRQQSMAKRQAQLAAGELPARKSPRKTEPTEAQRDASRRYWTTLASR